MNIHYHVIIEYAVAYQRWHELKTVGIPKCIKMNQNLSSRSSEYILNGGNGVGITWATHPHASDPKKSQQRPLTTTHEKYQDHNIYFILIVMDNVDNPLHTMHTIKLNMLCCYGNVLCHMH